MPEAATDLAPTIGVMGGMYVQFCIAKKNMFGRRKKYLAIPPEPLIFAPIKNTNDEYL